MSLNPYLYFNGQCEEAFTFYEKRLGGKITFLMRYEGSPMAGQAPTGYAKKVLHAGLALGDGLLEGCDASPGEYQKPQSFCVMFRPKDAKEADRVFEALAEDGTVQGHFQATGVRPRFLSDLVAKGIVIPGSFFDPSKPL